MRVAVPVNENRGMESEISTHFGRARYFAFVDIEGNDVAGVEVVPVPFEEHDPGDLPNFVKEHGGDVVLAYGMGGKAMAYFRNLGIEVVTGAYGRLDDVIRAFVDQVLMVDPHWRERIEAEKEHTEKI